MCSVHKIQTASKFQGWIINYNNPALQKMLWRLLLLSAWSLFKVIFLQISFSNIS